MTGQSLNFAYANLSSVSGSVGANNSVVFSVLLDKQKTLFDDKNRAVWATPAGVEGMTMQADMIRKYKITPESAVSEKNDDLYDQFHAGRIAIVRGASARIPRAMQALGAEKLQERQVKGLSDFAALLPSVSFEGIGPGRNTAFFRGIVPAGAASTYQLIATSCGSPASADVGICGTDLTTSGCETGAAFSTRSIESDMPSRRSASASMAGRCP